MNKKLRATLAKYPLYFLAWTLIGLFFFSQDFTRKIITRDPTPWWHFLATWMTGVWALALFTPLLFRISRQFPIERHGWPRRVALHLFLSVCFSIIDLAAASLILPNLGVFPAYMSTVARTFVFLLIASFHGNILVYWSLLGIEHGLRYYRSYQERAQEALRLELQASDLKARLVHEQLSALKMQLQPHFLFNTLNAIMVLVRQQKGRQAEDMISCLSDLLRCVLEDVEAQEVSLRRELEYLQLYLSIEQARFQDRLRVEISMDPVVLDAAIPQMGLQPIVENAIRHGIGRSLAAGMIRISAGRVDGSLEIKVEDDGPGFSTAQPGQGSGIGLPNTRARLEQLYGSAGRLILENREEGGAVVTMVVPFRRAPEILKSRSWKSMRLTALIVDDEPLARQGLGMLLSKDPDVLSMREARNGREAIAAIREAKPDLVFLDVQMPEIDGLSVVREIGADNMPAVVFVTAHDRYAIQAFEINAIDYLLKPVSEKRFLEAMKRVKARFKSESPEDANRQIMSLLEAVTSPQRFLKRVAVKSAGKITFVNVGDVDWIEAAENYVELHVGRASHLLHVTLSAVSKLLDPETFVPIHRSIIVNVGRVQALEPAAHGEYVVTLQNGVRLRSGRTYNDKLKAMAANPF